MGESSAKQQDDTVLERFRRKLADVVTVAINSGKRVSAERQYCHSPLGCHPGAPFPHPTSGEVSEAFGIADVDAYRFILGFSGIAHTSPYAELGRLYRARFP